MKIIKPSFGWLADYPPDFHEILAKIAAAGRKCYQSEPNTTDAEYVRRIIDRGHESVIEHALISVDLTCDRGITHEAVRHRIASYSQESTRYCNYSKGKFGAQITYIDITRGIELCPVTSKLDPGIIAEIITEWVDACLDAERHYMRMIELGASPQIARSVLNNSTKTGIVISMNPREWRHFFKLRNDPAAHPQMREVAGMMLAEFKNAIPVIFDDLEV
jgi:thymidylate synthase (FAD)